MLITACIASAQLLPTIEFGLLSKRWVGTPDPVGWSDYIPNTIATAVLLVFALGALTPRHAILTNLLPGVGKARVPMRALHLVRLGVCPLAAYGYGALPRHALLLRRGWLALGGALTLWAVLHPGFDERVLLSALLALLLIALHGVDMAMYSSRYHPDQFKFAGRLQENKDLANFLRRADLQAPARISVREEDIPLNFGVYHGIPQNLLRAETQSLRSQVLFSITHHPGKHPNHPGQSTVYEGASGVKIWANPNIRPAPGPSTKPRRRQRWRSCVPPCRTERSVWPARRCCWERRRAWCSAVANPRCGSGAAARTGSVCGPACRAPAW